MEWSLMITGFIGDETAYALLKERKEKLLERYSPEFIEKARKQLEGYERTDVPDILSDMEDTKLFHIGGQGLNSSLWLFAEELSAGFKIHLDNIPMHQCAVEFTDVFDLNIYDVPSGGSFIICTKDRDQVSERLEKAGISVREAGVFNGTNKRIFITHEGITRYAGRPGDEENNYYETGGQK